MKPGVNSPYIHTGAPGDQMYGVGAKCDPHTSVGLVAAAGDFVAAVLDPLLARQLLR